MTQYSFTQEQRAAFRKAITSAPAWDLYRTVNGLTASALSVDDMLKAAAEFGINPADYGTPRTFRPYGAPKEKPYGAEVLQGLKTKASQLSAWLTVKETDFFWNIVNTAENKQESRLTEKQHAILSGIVAKAHDRFILNEKPTPAAAEPIPAAKVTPDPLPPYVSVHPIPNMPQPISAATDAETALRILLTAIGQKDGAGITEARVIDLIKQHGATPATVTVDLRTPDMPRQKEGVLMHYKTPLLLSAVNAGVNIMLIGPAGSGKTTAAHQIAETMNLPFYFTGAIDSAYKLTGFIDAQGRTVRTAFREAYEHGGVFLFDELDGSMPSAVLAFNAALANGHADFPDGMVTRHKDFRAIAAMNTYGRGASREYVGRLQLDAASLDRFVTLAWDYDTALESALVGASRPAGAPLPFNVTPMAKETAEQAALAWFDTVQKTRAKIELQNVRHIVSPRATLHGAKLLAAGWPYAEVLESVLFKGIDSETRAKIAA